MLVCSQCESLVDVECRILKICLKVISDHISSTSREAVLVVIMDNLRWDDLPQDLKLILTEKTFLEFPKNSRLVENFWENLCVQLNK